MHSHNPMDESPLSLLELKKRLEARAFTYGVSSAVSTLLGEYVLELLTKPYYVRHTNKTMV
jgi:hypothetical protein